MATINMYKTYAFRNKDPIIDQVRTIIQDEGLSYKDIENRSRVAATTMYNWFHGTTRKPQNASLKAVIRACSGPEIEYDYAIIKRRKGETKFTHAVKSNGRSRR